MPLENFPYKEKDFSGSYTSLIAHFMCRLHLTSALIVEISGFKYAENFFYGKTYRVFRCRRSNGSRLIRGPNSNSFHMKQETLNTWRKYQSRRPKNMLREFGSCEDKSYTTVDLTCTDYSMYKHECIPNRVIRLGGTHHANHAHLFTVSFSFSRAHAIRPIMYMTHFDAIWLGIS